MAIISWQAEVTGTAGVIPNIVRVNTTDTAATIIFPGYLDSAVAEGLSLNPGDIILINSTTGPAFYNYYLLNKSVILTPAVNTATLEPHSVVLGPTVAGGSLQTVTGQGTAGQVLTSQGASLNPVWSNAGGGGGITSVTGTANRISVANPSTTPVVDIDAAYVGQSTITTLGTVATGTWNATAISLAKGGTNANLTASNGGIFYSTATAGAILSGTATAGQALLSGSSAAPAWSTTVWPLTVPINQVLYTPSANTIAGLTTANNGVLATSATGVPSISQSITLPNTASATVGTVYFGTTLMLSNFGTSNAFGGGAGNLVAPGDHSTAFGVNAMASAANANYCVAVGYNALTSDNFGGPENVAIGAFAMSSMYNGGQNVAVGMQAFQTSGNGNYNVILGYSAFGSNNGNSNIGIGYTAGSAFTGTESNNIILGNAGILGDNGTIRIGTSGSHLYAFMAGIAGISVTSGAPVLINSSTGQLGSAALSNGQLLIGSTGFSPVAATLTAGTGISVTNTAGAITIASTVTGTVTSVSGTANRISVTSPTTTPVVDIAATYVGQTSITTLGTVTTGAWNATTIAVSYGGTGATTLSANGILIGNGTSAVSATNLTNGQLLIGSTGVAPVAATLTAGSGITITNTAGAITIAAGGASYVDQTATSVTMAVNTTYGANNASLVTLTLPATAVVGSIIKVLGVGAGGWLIAQQAGQSIRIGSSVSTVGVGGSVASTNRGDGIELICTTANTGWQAAVGPQGNITVV